MKSCIFENSDMSLTLSINSAEVLKKISDEKAEISIKINAETKADFEEETDLVKKLARADNDAALII